VLKALLGGLLILCLTSAAVASAVLLQVDKIADGIRVTPPAVGWRWVIGLRSRAGAGRSRHACW
jgi:hypothetical protein